MKSATQKTENAPANPLDSKMTPGQVARRRFKSGLPRKTEHRTLSPMRALGELFTLLDQFLGFVMAEKQSEDAANTVYAALAYSLPDEKTLARTLTVPNPKDAGAFCDAVLNLGVRNPEFLGIVFVQVDPDAENTKYKSVSFAVPFMSGPDAAARLMYAQKEELAKLQTVLQGAGT
jgi:hypothetical protein